MSHCSILTHSCNIHCQHCIIIHQINTMISFINVLNRYSVELIIPKEIYVYVEPLSQQQQQLSSLKNRWAQGIVTTLSIWPDYKLGRSGVPLSNRHTFTLNPGRFRWRCLALSPPVSFFIVHFCSATTSFGRTQILLQTRSILTVPLRSSKSAHHTTAHIPFLICLSSKSCRLGCPPATERSITTFNTIFDSVEASDGTISATNGWQCPRWVVGWPY